MKKDYSPERASRTSDLIFDTPAFIYYGEENYSSRHESHEYFHLWDFLTLYPYPLLNTVIFNFHFQKVMRSLLANSIENDEYSLSQSSKVRRAISNIDNFWSFMRENQSYWYEAKEEKDFLPLEMLAEIRAVPYSLNYLPFLLFGNNLGSAQSERFLVHRNINSSKIHKISLNIWNKLSDHLSNFDEEKLLTLKFIIKGITGPPTFETIFNEIILREKESSQSEKPPFLVPPLEKLALSHLDPENYLQGKSLEELRRKAIKNTENWIDVLKKLKRRLFHSLHYGKKTEIKNRSDEIQRMVQARFFPDSSLEMSITFPLQCMIDTEKIDGAVIKGKEGLKDLSWSYIDSVNKNDAKSLSKKEKLINEFKWKKEAGEKVQKLGYSFPPPPPSFVVRNTEAEDDGPPKIMPILMPKSMLRDVSKITNWMDFFLISHIMRKAKKAVFGEDNGRAVKHPIQCPLIEYFGNDFVSSCEQTYDVEKGLSGCRCSREERLTPFKIKEKNDCPFWKNFLRSGLGYLFFEWD